VREGLNTALIGAVIGLLCVCRSPINSGLLFGISSADPVTFFSGAAFLLAVAGTISHRVLAGLASTANLGSLTYQVRHDAVLAISSQKRVIAPKSELPSRKLAENF